MRICLFFLAIFPCYSAFCQLNDSFSDGDFTANPTWSGSNSGNDFTIVSNRLRSNSTIANSNFYLSTANALADNCYWEFWVNLQFSTSGANYADVYLISDKADLQSANINGYFVRIGNTEDEISLYKRTGARSTSVKIIDGTDGIINSSSNNIVKIKVSRTANLFRLERDLTGTGANYFNEGSIPDATITSTSSFGVYIQQSTATFIQKHFFDDFKITAIVMDHAPPQLLSATVIDSLTIEAIFNEALENISATNVLNYTLNYGFGNPSIVRATTDPAKFRLVFTNSLITGNYLLTVNNVADRSNNFIATNNTTSFNYIKPYIARLNDVIINEIFADPTPQIGLPAIEFIELWNTSSHNISLKNWKYADLSTTATLPSDTIPAGEYVIICARADTNSLKPFGKTIGISPWPSLNNTGDNLILKNEQGTIINQVSYSDSWYKDVIKKAGGWTLELIDPLAICTGIQNWTAGKDPGGGTPGKPNSQYKSNTTTEQLKLMSAVLTDSVTLIVTFNRAVDSLSASAPANYTLNNGAGSPSASLPLTSNFNQVQLKFPSQIARGYKYQITVNGVTDCIGIVISSASNSAGFMFTRKILKNDILISEILFNPRPGGVDFVEVYSNSDHELDLKELAIATLAKGKDSLISIKPLSTSQFILKPKEYLVLTINPDNIKKEYHTENPNAFIKMASMPGFNNDEGVVVLLSDYTRVDQLNYHEKMHLRLIKNVEGISLERSSFNRPTNEPENFQSAAGDVGYATPGYKNSQLTDTSGTDEDIFLTSKTFSPDNDGFEDMLQVNYHFAKPGAIANASVYTDKGILIHRLAKNLTLSTQGSLQWNGVADYSNNLPVGIYILYMEIFDLNGKVRKYKKNFVLAAKLN